MAGADESEGTFGGNGSVHWRVDARLVKSINYEDHGNGHHTQEGHTGSADGGRFTITLQRPEDDGERDRLARGLRDAADALAGGADEGTFELIIERQRHRQVSVKWLSADETFTPTVV